MILPDVLVVGAGVIGMAVARELARRGMSVRVLTRDAPGAGASSAAAGMLEVHHPLPVPAELGKLCVFSRALYPDWIAALREETGIDAGLDETGSLLLASDEVAWTDLRAQAREIPSARVLDAGEVRALEPGVGPGMAGGVLLPDDHHVDAPRLGAALLRALETGGVPIERGVTVRGVAARNGRVEGVETDAGLRRAGWTVLAAGAWAGGLAGLPDPLPVRPVKGQLLVLEGGPLPGRVLQGRATYLVPRARDRRLLLGATVEEAGFDVSPTAGAAAALLAEGLRLFPEAAAARLAGIRVGLRPATPDGLPILGHARLRGLVVAAGHFRKGILLAPATARLVAALVRSETPDLPLEAFAPARFAHADHGQR